MIVPPRIRPGDAIGVVAPAGPVRFIRLFKGLERLGEVFPIELAPSLVTDAPRTTASGGPTLAGPRQREAGVPSYLSASDETRAAEFNAMLANPDIRAIILARGGYGIMRILPLLDAEALRRDPKPIVGFSDATALLAWAHHAGVRAIHGPVIAQLSDLGASHVAHLVHTLTSPEPAGIRPWTLINHGASGVVDGPVIPANLTLASMLVGTPWALPLADAIALFEEVGERPYELDRYLTQLALTGQLARVRALLLGDLTRCDDLNPATGEKDPPNAALVTVLERMRAAAIPTASGAPVGHAARNEALPFAARAVLDFDHATFELLEAAVS